MTLNRLLQNFIKPRVKPIVINLAVDNRIEISGFQKKLRCPGKCVCKMKHVFAISVTQVQFILNLLVFACLFCCFESNRFKIDEGGGIVLVDICQSIIKERRMLPELSERGLHICQSIIKERRILPESAERGFRNRLTGWLCPQFSKTEAQILSPLFQNGNDVLCF